MIRIQPLSRLLSRDPIAENGGINLYKYNYNNPSNYMDPDGLTPFVTELIGAGIRAVVGGG
jgi:uncharacterized protein RhaS with RHS repeats